MFTVMNTLCGRQEIRQLWKFICDACPVLHKEHVLLASQNTPGSARFLLRIAYSHGPIFDIIVDGNFHPVALGLVISIHRGFTHS